VGNLHGIEKEPWILLRAGPPRVVPRLDTDPDSSGNSFRSRHKRPRSDSKTAASVIAPCDSVNGVAHEKSSAPTQDAGCWVLGLGASRFSIFDLLHFSGGCCVIGTS